MHSGWDEEAKSAELFTFWKIIQTENGKRSNEVILLKITSMFIYSVTLNNSMGMTSSEFSTDCWYTRKSKDWVLTILQGWSLHPSVLVLSSRGWLCLHLHYLMALRTRADNSEVKMYLPVHDKLNTCSQLDDPWTVWGFPNGVIAHTWKVMKWQSKNGLQRALGSGCTRGMQQFVFLTGALLLDSDTRILAELTDRVDIG